ncbi:MAG TPA: response regulator [Nitrospirae bacterium]|nr:response regulator [Nitrospirota bacterium]
MSQTGGSSTRRGRILLVDDNRLIHNLLRDFLTERGFSLQAAFSVSEAKKRLVSESFDMVITDYNLPDGSGTDVVEFIRQNRAGTKIIGISGNEDGEIFYAAGADGFIAKPFKVVAIFQLINNLLEERLKEVQG